MVVMQNQEVKIKTQKSPTPGEVTNALSFDIEDWFHLVEVDAVSDTNQWPKLPSLVEQHTRWIVDTVSAAGIRATFFMLGWVAERYPHLTKLIADSGHELGTHSYWHRRVDLLGRDEFREDLKRSINIIEQQSGRAVLGFRAPSFSVTPGAEWAFDVMHEAGIVYDASLFPAPRGQGGYPCPQEAHAFTKTPSGRPMPELPMSVLRHGPLRLPFSGGGYLRLLPGALIRYGFNRFNRNGMPVVVYLHPRDFAPECPRVPMPLHRRFKCYIGLGTTRRKLKMLLDRYRFDTCAAVLGLNEKDVATTPLSV